MCVCFMWKTYVSIWSVEKDCGECCKHVATVCSRQRGATTNRTCCDTWEATNMSFISVNRCHKDNCFSRGLEVQYSDIEASCNA
jgi:hypothetical protein